MSSCVLAFLWKKKMKHKILKCENLETEVELWYKGEKNLPNFNLIFCFPSILSFINWVDSPSSGDSTILFLINKIFLLSIKRKTSASQSLNKLSSIQLRIILYTNSEFRCIFKYQYQGAYDKACHKFEFDTLLVLVYILKTNRKGISLRIH